MKKEDLYDYLNNLNIDILKASENGYMELYDKLMKNFDFKNNRGKMNIKLRKEDSKLTKSGKTNIYGSITHVNNVCICIAFENIECFPPKLYVQENNNCGCKEGDYTNVDYLINNFSI